jgi:lysozyme
VTPPGIQGIDVSYAQARVDWQRVRAAGVEFGYIRQGYRLKTDVMWRQHAADAKAAGFPVGAYHFAYVDQDPLDEVQRFIDDGAVDAPGLTLRPVLDLETSNNAPASLVLYWAQTWLDEVSSRCGVLPILYTGPAFWMGLGAQAKLIRWAQYPLWIAHYTSAPKPIVPPPWVDYSMWQWSGSGRVDGVQGDVDRNVIHPGGNLDWLQWRYSVV